jgi:dTDP-4-dehydrorhamnose reductase
MKLVVFGANGMLGRYVSTYFKRQGHVVKEVTRQEFDASDFSQYNKIPVIIEGADAVVNCMGIIKSETSKHSDVTSFMVNSVFPNYLARANFTRGIPFYHITTDCVYTGHAGKYTEESYPDMLDVYGFSKSLGDYCSQYGFVIRTSIIGEELYNNRSLIQWVKSQAGKEVTGYINHTWNGVTCLQLAKVLETLMAQPYAPGLLHVYSEDITKYELVRLISDVYDLNVIVLPGAGPEFCNRTLDSISQNYLPMPSLREQLEELKDFYEER